MDEIGREWLKQFMENELSIFEAYDDEDYINHQLSTEDQDLLFEDLNGALFDELEEHGTNITLKRIPCLNTAIGSKMQTF